MMKVKVAFGNDMRLFKYDGASLSEAWDLLTAFVVKTFEVEEFRLQYRDDEDDLITVSSADELDEAFDFAMEQGKTLKVFVVAVAAQQASIARGPVVEAAAAEEKERADDGASSAPATDEKQRDDENGGADAPSTGPTKSGCEGMRDFASLILEDEGFRQEVAAFAQDVVLQVREGDNLDTAISTALAGHEELNAHPLVREHLAEMLPVISAQGAFAVPFLKTMEPTAIPGMIEQAARAMRDGQNMMMPLLASMMAQGCGGAGGNAVPPAMGPFGGFGGMPFFGGGFGPHGQPRCPPGAGQGFPFGPGGAFGGHGRHGHGHGRGGHGHGRGHGHGHGRGGRGGRGGRFGGGGCGKKAKGGFRAEIVDPNVTLVDKALVLPNSSVVKTWRIQNSGQEDFPEGTKLKYVGRPFNQLVDGVEFPVEAIPVGEEGEVSILLSTPATAGRFGSAWRLQLPDGTPFGPMFRARVVVVSEDGTGAVEAASDESDDMADIYDTEPPASDKKAKKLEKLMAKKAKLEAQSARLGSRLNNVRSRIDEMSAVEDAPIVSTLPGATAGGDDDDEDGVDDAAVVVVEDEAGGAFAHELAELQSMGFGDLRLNRMLLEQYNGQMDAVLNTLLAMKA